MDIFAVLNACDWLADVPEPTLHAWCEQCVWRHVQAHDLLFTPDTAVEWVYVLATGEVRLTSAHTAAAIDVTRPGTVLDAVAVWMAPQYEQTARCLAPTQVVCVPHAVWCNLAALHPPVWHRGLDRVRDQMLAESLTQALHHALPCCDAPAIVRLAFDEGRWWNMARGESLFKTGDPLEAWYVLVSGQLAEFDARADVDDPARNGQPDGVLHPGDLVGDADALLGQRHHSSVFALRDAWLLRLQPHEFDTLVLQQPVTLAQVARRALQRRQATRHDLSTPLTWAVLTDDTLPAQGEPLLSALCAAMGLIQPVAMLTAPLCEAWGLVPDLPHRQRADLEWLRLDAWVQRQQAQGKCVVLVADAQASVWRAQITRLADRLLFLADAQGGVSTPPTDWWPAPTRHTTVAPPRKAWELQQWLCLVHPADTPHPQGTQAWLAAWQPHKHFHVRLHHAADLGRLVRHLTGQAIGLALSGGGGRGPTHAGVFKALAQAQVPIDCVVGASAGALMGCLLAQDNDWTQCAEQSVTGIGPPPGPFGDLTLPLVSIAKSKRLHDSVRRTFPDARLEDAWIPCFVVATNLTQMKKTVFSQGEVWQAALASVSPPGVAKPRIMGGELVCDGGLIENLPVSVLIEQQCRYIITSNISTQCNLSLDAPDFPSPWAILFDRVFRGGRATAAVPTAIDILLASTTLASEDNRQAMSPWVDMAITPQLQGFKSTDFTQSQALIERGFADAHAQIAQHQGSAHCPALWHLVDTCKALAWPPNQACTHPS